MSDRLPVPDVGEQARALRMVGGDERRARIAWALVLEPGRERPGHDRSALAQAVLELGHVEAWERLVRGDLRRAEAARSRVAEVDVDAELGRARLVGSRVLVPGDAEWPGSLNHPDVAPHVLYARGPNRLDVLSSRAVAVVGSRASTGYGESVARELGAGLARRGRCVVSGLAYGIDAAAHLGALAVDGPCLAVLPCGPDQVYPQAHRRIVDAIAGAGLVVSEQPCGRTAQRHRFLTRNRLIAALSSCAVVVEAGLRSGSLNTAGWAERLGRPVGAVPGPVTSMASAGCHDWIARGRATLVSDAEDVDRLAAPVGDAAVVATEVLELLGPGAAVDRLDQHQRRVYDLLSRREERSVGWLARELVMPVMEVLSLLGPLQAAGWVVQGDTGWCRGDGPGDARAPGSARG